MPGSLGHLVYRFFDVLAARPLDEDESMLIRTWLTPAQSAIFFEQPAPDQRHALHAARVVIAAGGEDQTALTAALLHDVGKRSAGLGVIRRSVASLLILLGLPLTRRMTRYRDHGTNGADELSKLGCDELVVEFARHHHDSRPDGFPSDLWDLLQTADQPPKPGTTLRARIS
jgi:putative nucleotidyltransferase with HDIG domain